MNEAVIYKHDGKVTNRPVLKELFEQLPDGKYLVTAKNIRKRSLPQNAYYWGVVVPMVREGLYDIGYREVKTNDDAHEILKHIFLKKKVINQANDDVIEIAGSTADLKTIEFNTFLEEVWQWSSAYLGVCIPAPGEQSQIFANG